jgi:hypothetical protein
MAICSALVRPAWMPASSPASGTPLRRPVRAQPGGLGEVPLARLGPFERGQAGGQQHRHVPPALLDRQLGHHRRRRPGRGDEVVHDRRVAGHRMQHGDVRVVADPHRHRDRLPAEVVDGAQDAGPGLATGDYPVPADRRFPVRYRKVTSREAP